MRKVLFLLLLSLSASVVKTQAQSRCYDASSDCNLVPHTSQSFMIEARCGDNITLLATRELCNTWSQTVLLNATFNVDSSEAYIVIDSINSQLLYIVYGFTDGPTGSCLTDYLYSIAVIRDTIYTNTVSCDSLLDGTSQIIYESSNVCDSVVITTFTYTPPKTISLISSSCNPDSIGRDTSIVYGSAGCDSVITIVTTELMPLDTVYLRDTTCNPMDTMTRRVPDYDQCILNIYITDLIGPIVGQSTIWKDSCSDVAIRPDTMWFSSLQGNGCDSIVVTQYNTHPFPRLDISPYPNCGEETLVEVFPWGSTEPYVIAWSDGSEDEVRSFDSDQEIGVTIVDSLGCRIDTSITVDIWENSWIDLGEDMQISLGDEVEITAVSSPGTISHSSALIDQTDIPVGSSLRLSPVHSGFISAMVIDSNGCSAMDTINITVISDIKIFIPSAFSPNNDGINDTFTVFGGESVSSIKELAVFDRWGNHLFQGLDLTPNNLSQGWDGLYKGKPMDPAVFAYFAKIEFINGEVRLYKGDINLFR